MQRYLAKGNYGKIHSCLNHESGIFRLLTSWPISKVQARGVAYVIASNLPAINVGKLYSTEFRIGYSWLCDLGFGWFLLPKIDYNMSVDIIYIIITLADEKSSFRDFAAERHPGQLSGLCVPKPPG